MSQKEHISPAHGRLESAWPRLCAMVLAGAAIVSSAFHFWPFEGSKAWQLLCPANMAVCLWILLLFGYALQNSDRRIVISFLPHVSVFAYLCINALSVAFAQNSGRVVNFTVKLALMLVGGYLLLVSAMSGARSMRTVLRLTIAAVIISVSCCLVARYGFASEGFGFFGSAYKYGTYTGILAPLCAAYLFTGRRWWEKLAGVALIVGVLLSSGSLGMAVAVLPGLAAFTVVTRGWSGRIAVAGSLAGAIGLLILLGPHSATAAFRDDVGLGETDGVNLKQRYIEWQAELNLLEERAITGTGAGCINDYRSNFYYRLPKLNTLKAFDQNGWLATGAEIGIIGLVCFCWIVAHYFRLAWSQLTATRRPETPQTYRFAVAGFVGLLSACAANLFSSVHYNGILIAFVLVLALVSGTEMLSKEQKNANN
ncbi:MAG: O-antigen ligase family protein [Planctomycetota bacterium]|jgi:hypothetical protein